MINVSGNVLADVRLGQYLLAFHRREIWSLVVAIPRAVLVEESAIGSGKVTTTHLSSNAIDTIFDKDVNLTVVGVLVNQMLWALKVANHFT